MTRSGPLPASQRAAIEARETTANNGSIKKFIWRIFMILSSYQLVKLPAEPKKISQKLQTVATAQVLSCQERGGHILSGFSMRYLLDGG
jgi:hypothetical protein